MGCPSGYSDIASYPRLTPLAVLPWDHDGSPCREAYNGTIESLWNEFVIAIGECPRAPGRPNCVLSSCIIAKYAAYLSTFNAAGTTYANCSNTEA